MSYKNRINELKNQLIEELISKIKSNNAIEIELHDNLIYQYIDDQFNEVICNINVKTKKFSIDDGINDIQWISLDELDIEQLAYILDEVDSGDFDIWEEEEI